MIDPHTTMFPLPPMDYNLNKKYHIKIVRRDFQGQTADDYHATVTRLSDGTELVWMATFKWWLKIKIRRAALDRAFRSYDKSKAKHEKTEEFFA